MKHIILVLAILFIVITVQLPKVRAYTLPYPSAMPGNKLYTISRVIDALKKYWYFGNIGQIKYHSMLADKYLVESKILFEYEQFLLATDALQRSNDEFNEISHYIYNAENEGKNIEFFRKQYKEQIMKHVSVLHSLKQLTPESYMWRPEKSTSIFLPIHTLIDTSLDLRQQPL